MPRQCRFTPGEEAMRIVWEALLAIDEFWMCAKKLATHRNSNPGPSNL